jgi:integrase
MTVAKKTDGRIRLNKTDVGALEPDPRGTRFYPVAEFKGLVVQVTKGGAKSFVLRYRFEGRQKIHTLGSFPAMTAHAAEKAHSAAWTKIHDKVDPNAEREAKRKAAAEKARNIYTVSDLADKFIKEHIKVKNKASTQAEHTRLVEKLIKPRMGAMNLKEVGPADVAGVLLKMQRETPIQANRVRAVLSKMFSKAELWELRPVGSNPVRGQDRSPETKKERNLSDREIVALGKAFREAAVHRFDPDPTKVTDPESDYALAALRLSLLTGMRKGEILALRRAWLDLESGVVHIPPEAHKTGAITGRERLVHLCGAAVELLRALPQGVDNPFVILGARPKNALVDLQSPWERLRESVTEASRPKIEGKARKTKKPEPTMSLLDVTIHDLRRTFSSVGARLGYAELFHSALLGHAAGTVTQGYARVGQDPLHDAAETIGSRIAGLLDGTIDPDQEAEERKKVAEEKCDPGKMRQSG